MIRNSKNSPVIAAGLHYREGLDMDEAMKRSGKKQVKCSIARTPRMTFDDAILTEIAIEILITASRLPRNNSVQSDQKSQGSVSVVSSVTPLKRSDFESGFNAVEYAKTSAGAALCVESAKRIIAFIELARSKTVEVK